MSETSRHHRLVATVGGARTYQALASLVTAALTARYLGPSGRGVLVAALAWVTLMSTFGHLSLSQVAIFVAAEKRGTTWAPAVVGGLFVAVVSVSIAGAAIVAVLYASTGGSLVHNVPFMTLSIALLAFPLMMALEDGNGVLTALGRLDLLSTGQLINGTTLALFTFLAVRPLALGVNGAVLAVVLAQAATVGMIVLWIRNEVGRIHFDWDVTRTLLTGGAKLHLNAIGSYLFTQANVLILNHFRTSDETAWFQLALQVVTAIQVIPMAVSSVAYSLVSKHGADAAWPHQRKLLLEVLLVSAGLAVAGYVLAPVVVPRVFGPAFAPLIPVLRLLLLAVIGMTFSTAMASQWIARGFFLQASLLTLLVGALTVLGNYLVVPRFGMIGAAWVTNAVYLVSILGNGAMALWVNARWRRAAIGT